jgi:hypothetical protein
MMIELLTALRHEASIGTESSCEMFLAIFMPQTVFRALRNYLRRLKRRIFNLEAGSENPF